MYDFIICKKSLPVPENFLSLNWSEELFRTNSLSNKFDNYIISDDGFLYKKKSNLEKVNYSGFINFSTHFFDEPCTKQYYIAFFSSFKDGLLEELSLDGIKEYSLQDYNNKYPPISRSTFSVKKIRKFTSIFDLFKRFFK